MKTVLITGASSGIGKAAAQLFAEQGWNVAATMRTPAKEQELAGLPNVRLYALDVTRTDTIQSALEAAGRDFGRIDVVVNNAGFGVDGVFEAMTDEVIEGQFDTNVFGLMRVTREAVKLMREQGGGTIIQIASMGGRLAFPLYSIYHGTKWAVEGFSESLHYELKPLGIHLKIIEPGATRTEFAGRSRQFIRPDYTQAYDAFIRKVDKVNAETMEKGESPRKIAETIVKAAGDTSGKLRYPVGNPAPVLLRLRKLLPETLFFGIIRNSYKL
ncbi:SDR family oxidoreductase [Larkinella soli]|uniref:SDR family oxidoreductase n=1 Tax=Larkinella soli TaxID=1770527 RepID=UPI0019CFC0A0|nr:SDR family oxidoreductase [Larkinella soli]